MNYQISYLYRDAANYKQFESVVISTENESTAEELQEKIQQRFLSYQVWPDILHFRPEELGWPTAYFNEFNEDDYSLHELDEILPTDAAATAEFNL